jgi:hypothetical protein
MMGLMPADSPSSPSDYANVAVQPVNIQAPDDEAAISVAFDATNREMGAGVIYAVGPRQRESASFMDSAEGYGSFGVLAGTTAGWPADTEPSA